MARFLLPVKEACRVIYDHGLMCYNIYNYFLGGDCMESDKKNFGWDFLFSDECEYSDNNDGSDGHKYSDGSGYYNGADGSEGYKYSDGSGYYRGADGSDGYIYSDGSGYFHGSDGTSLSFDARGEDDDDDDSSDSNSETDWVGLGTSLLGLAAAYAVKTSSDREKERERVLAEKRKERNKYIKENWQDILACTVFFGTIILVAAEYGIYRLLVHTESLSAEEICAALNRFISIEDPGFLMQSLYFFRWQWLIIVVVAIMISMVVLLIMKMRRRRKMRAIGFDPDDLIGSTYKSVVERLRGAGFTAIATEAIKDLTLHETRKLGEVARVSIEGKTEYTCYSQFPFDAPIVVYYHARQDICPPISSNGCINANYAVVAKRFMDEGFTEIHIEPVPDLINGWITKDGSIKQITIDGKENFCKRTKFAYDANVIIRYHTFKKKK